jgi:hypothetical protein
MVIRFMTLFQKLKDWSDDDPESLLKLAEKDEGMKRAGYGTRRRYGKACVSVG